MPIFEYDCEECHQASDILVRHDSDVPHCTKCGSARLHRKMSAPSFHLKGNGWYKTDFGGKQNHHKEKIDYEPVTKLDNFMEDRYRKNDKDASGALKADGEKNLKDGGVR